MNDFFDKKLKILSLASLTALCVFLFAAAIAFFLPKNVKDFPNHAIITAKGQAEILATPDIASFTFTARAEDKSAKSAQQKMVEIANKAIAVLEAQGISKESIKTESYLTFPNYEFQNPVCSNGYCPPAKRILRGYEASEVLSVKIEDFAKAGEVLSLIADAGVAEVSELSFEVKNIEKLKNEAKKVAILKAKSDAKNIADSLGVRLGRVAGFSENEQFGYGGFRGNAKMMAMASDATAVAPIEAGQNKITSSVSISYEID